MSDNGGNSKDEKWCWGYLKAELKEFHDKFNVVFQRNSNDSKDFNMSN